MTMTSTLEKCLMAALALAVVIIAVQCYRWPDDPQC